MDEGWTRWILEKFGFAYTSVGNREIRGGVNGRYDVLIFADQPAPAIEDGYRQGSMPEEFTGGLGEPGAAALRNFAASGGTLIFLNRASVYATGRLGVSAKDAVRDLSSQQFYVPGSLLNVRLKRPHPIALGLPDEFAAWAEHSPVWEPSSASLAEYVPSKVLASGWLLGEQHIAGKSALMAAPTGKGKVLLFGMRPQYRAQSYLTFKLLFNALLPW
jgi:hypothetical protein